MKDNNNPRETLWTRLQGFSVNKNGHLALRDVDLVSLAASTDRPLYVFDEMAIRGNIQLYKKALALFYPGSSSLFYASKAFLNLAMAALLDQEGMGIDVCSEGELFIAQQAGICPENILMHGNNKSEQELRFAVESGIKRIVVDNVGELRLLEKVTTALKKECSVLLRLNPGIPIEAHQYLTTGIPESKFGFYTDQKNIPAYLSEAQAKGYIKFKGLHFHIGSNIQKASFYENAIDKVLDYVVFLKDQGIRVEDLNIGGGLGIAHQDHEPLLDIHDFLKVICEKIVTTCGEKGLALPHLMFEPGRSIVGQAGCTLYTIGSIKEGPNTKLYVAVNGGMTDNLRPSLYQAKYTAVLANKMKNSEQKRATKIVGKCCEPDVLIEEIFLPPCAVGDVLVVFSTGAYTHSLASNYNKLTLPRIVFIREGTYTWVSKEQSLEDLIRLDQVPPHLEREGLKMQ